MSSLACGKAFIVTKRTSRHARMEFLNKLAMVRIMFILFGAEKPMLLAIIRIMLRLKANMWKCGTFVNFNKNISVPPTRKLKNVNSFEKFY